MTTELEQEFFRVFGIEPIEYRKNVPCLNFLSSGICNITDERCNPSKCSEYRPDKTNRLWRDFMEVYPEITDHKLLEMICIILNADGLLTINTEGNIADIKDFVLRFLIGKVNKNNPYCHYKTKNKIKHQIQQLFKEEE